ncbi:predicted protein [Verticillium alfalfae VaMs.102]|uniref:Predicted protein n=1 Tax=Verticillium alfalfae (strain VaMs.102 / ATCC MYA-4576 / FGSC 10136) TaxID=526221 RepID=C9SDB4_VERA1|nr:predicted protein [Verticillium alfalfae VaMs.102]EEY17066.1 predicted protein [Verticillium alfalfae VaMs.102]
MASASAPAQGFPGVPFERVVGETWKVNPMPNPIVSKWTLDLSQSDVTKLLKGFQPLSMEDRWMSRAEGPDADGIFLVSLYRSWTANQQFQIKGRILSRQDAQSKGSGYRAQIEELTWDNGQATSTEAAAKDMAISVMRWILECDLEHLS